MNFDESSWFFFISVLLFSWSLWLIIAFSELSIDTTLGLLIYIIGAGSPSIIGLLLARFISNEGYWGIFKKRIFSLKLIQLKWVYFIFGFPLIVLFAEVLLNYIATSGLPNLSVLLNFIRNPVQLILFALLTLIGGPLLEEMGWRGYGLDKLLNNKMNMFQSSLIVAFIWQLWHWPLFLVEGTLQWNLIQESLLNFFVYNLEIFSYGIIIVWVVMNNHKSILAAILFHFSINFFSGITQFEGTIIFYRAIILFISALVVLRIFYKKETEQPNT